MGIKVKPISINSPKFYKKHPDLIPSNPLLAKGRIRTIEKVDKRINRILFIDSISRKFENFIQGVKNVGKNCFSNRGFKGNR